MNCSASPPAIQELRCATGLSQTRSDSGSPNAVVWLGHRSGLRALSIRL